jgi:hypothetical protein
MNSFAKAIFKPRRGAFKEHPKERNRPAARPGLAALPTRGC